MALDKIEELLEEGPVKLKDEDKDGLPDEWEKDHFKNLAKGAEDDPDDDNLTNLTELKLRTNPNKKDTDDDTLPDVSRPIRASLLIPIYRHQPAEGGYRR
ncbi:MAG: hypothetical protein CM1200mP29_16790 [Verrucomicrobiota bacterium]|nr:MAG: hypothetical protein CM1200mP29_16790 [Verrucomicrobiota bacterium]